MDNQKPSDVSSYKRDALFLTLSGIFLTALVLGNVIGTTKFVTIFSVELSGWMRTLVPELIREENTYTMSVPVGVIAYPFTFLATDLLSELYGRKKAQLVVWVGFWMNVFMLFLMTVNHWLPNTGGVSGGLDLFEGVYEFMIGNTIASMIAYLVAQTVDVRLFHFWKRLTQGKHLWLRNNASTTVSQLVDSTTILTILFIAGNLGEEIDTIGKLMILIINSYLFKFFFALFDTPLCYLGVKLFNDYDEDPSEYSLYS
ncbi:queuosine precursor transporter [Aliifodinibius salicampi]|uniref:Probable queuosine precursor transporter n=1 Tax=Fodinibius salicampi TaxID=1920655 RepID=A0ABT3Q1E7_9BACT|nr:queuosine precursor transporter [Fodinibius salicampi]MCW9713925.1 queuosine precursor transporter [Fodinibius salicampi]